jgi:hypothetical protein
MDISSSQLAPRVACMHLAAFERGNLRFDVG